MPKVVLDQITTSLGSVSTLNENARRIEKAFENTLSRDGSPPNAMQADLEMDGNDILNAGIITADELFVDGRQVDGKASKWWTGTGTPASSLGNVGDFYLQKGTNNVYEKTPEGWQLATNITGGDIDLSNYAHYQQEEDVRNLAVNGTEETYGFTGLRSPTQELIDNYSYDRSLTTQAASDLGELE